MEGARGQPMEIEPSFSDQLTGATGLSHDSGPVGVGRGTLLKIWKFTPDTAPGSGLCRSSGLF
jgi:hypothetical protein